MAGVTEAEEQPVATPKTPRSPLVRSASSFPQSFPVINRNLSNASTVFGESAEATTDQVPSPDRQPAAAAVPATEQVEERQTEMAASNAAVAGEQAHTDKAGGPAAESEISGATGTNGLNEGAIHAASCSGQMQHLDMEAEGQLPSNSAEETSSLHSVTAVDGSVCSAATAGTPAKQTAGEGAMEEGEAPAELDDTEDLLAKGLGSEEPSNLESSSQATEEYAESLMDSVPNGSKADGIAEPADIEGSTAKAVCTDQVIQASDDTERTEAAGSEAGDTGSGGAACLAVATPRETLEPRGSRTSLSPESEPFVPSQGSSQQVTPRANDKSGGSASLNANAATFVPSFATPAGDPPAPVSTAFPVQLRFGSLPDSLNPSPHISATDRQELPVYSHNGYEKGHQGSYENGHQGEDSAYSEQGQEWHAWEGDYDHYTPAYADGAYTHDDGSQYYQQEDGTWMSYWPEDDSGSHWQGHYDGEPQEHATNGDHKLGNGYYKNGGYENGGYENGGYENGGGGGYYENGGGTYENGYGGLRGRRGGRGSKRGPGRRQPGEGHRAWQSAAVDILEQQFHFSRECLQEMLDLHEGNFEVVLDMLAQLEAEMDGQLPASSQDAPELNEENFPSLGSNGSIGERPDALPQASKGGFAEAVRTPASPAPSPPPKTEATPDAGGRRHRAVPAEGARSIASTQVPWKETGAAVSEAYADARAIARDHARLRNTYFQEATKAFVAGNKALAKELGVKGREQSELMKAAHAEASKAIYKHRNPVSGRGKGRGPGLVDLHGLHVKEAVAVLEREVATARRASKPRSGRASPPRMSVLVGTGHHTKGSRTPSRLPAAIEDWLLAAQISFTRPAPGLLELTL